MSFRQRTTKPSVALWMLVAVGDIALILASFGMVALIALASVVTMAVGVVGAWRLAAVTSFGPAGRGSALRTRRSVPQGGGWLPRPRR
jgi:hypothetical protein